MATVPPSTPPMAYHEKALPVLVSVSSSDSDDLTALGHAISILARLRLQHRTTHDIQPLKLLLRRSETNAASFGMGLILNAVVAYPLHLKAISTIVTRVLADQPSFLDEIRREVIPSLVSRLRLSSSTPEMGSTIAVLLSVTRAHEELLGLALTEADYILPTLKEIYPKLGNGDKKCIRYRSDVLLLCHSLVTVLPGQGTSRDALKRLMGDGVGTSKKVLVDGALRSDYEAVFERKSGLGDEELANLADLRIDDTRADPRLAPLTNLFPHISPHLLSEALEHPQFCSLSPDYEEAAAPLIHEILTGGTSLPAELSDLRDAISQGSPQQANGASGAPRSAASSFVSHNQPASSMGAKKKIERRNIWDDEELDFSRLRLGKDDSSLEIGNTIPDQLRASIMRLVESQAEEEAERERALKDAGHRSFVAASRAVVGGVGSDDVEGEDEAGRDRVKIGKDGEESGEDEDAQDQKVIGSSNPPSSVGLYDVDQQSKLELAYLANPKLFDRDSKTRKSDARKRLREITGMADEQIEGWKIMLERNPHKDAILSRHTFTPAKNYLTPSSASSVVSGSNAGRGKGKGSEGSRGGGGSSRGGRGGGSGRGGGGGGEGSSVGGSRGGRGASRGNRGHSNAARTRGHDKKMAKMGAGV